MSFDAAQGVLNDHVQGGAVDYTALSKEPRLDQTIAAFADGTWPQHPEHLAYWINAYNLFTLSIVAQHHPIASINDLHKIKPMALAVATKISVWDTHKLKTPHGSYSLNTIEHKIIRKRFPDPRIHGALVCAAKSCPPLRDQLFEDSSINDQLDDQMSVWLNDKDKNRYSSRKNTFYASMILLWYVKDFRGNAHSVKGWIRKYSDEELPATFKLRYLNYDWTLNSQ